MRVLVTGASGFAGAAVMRALAEAGHEATAGMRRGPGALREAARTVTLPDLSAPFDADPLVRDVDAIVHLAGLAHSSSRIPQAVYDAVNATAPRLLAAAAAKRGLKRFVFISSVRAQTGPAAEGVVTEGCPPAPTDAYGRSKLAGECTVAETLAGTGTDFVILRPVLMYGPRAKGNMATLMRLARSPLPLPLGGFKARRSVLAVDNFAAAAVHALSAPDVRAQTFLVADGEPLNIAEIIAAFRRGLGRAPALLNVPPIGAAPALRFARRRDLADRLFGDLAVSTRALRQTGWAPSVSSEEGLARAMRE